MINLIKKKETIWVTIAILLGIAGIIFSSLTYKKVWKEASLSVTLTRSEAQTKAEEFLQSLAFSTEGYKIVTSFSFQRTALTYLEKEKGLEEANRVLKEDINFWKWRTRFFKPLQKEEFSVSHTTTGKLAGFYHAIEENLAGAKIPRPQARRKAGEFLSKVFSISLDNYKLVEEKTFEKAARTDHYFTWELEDFPHQEAPYRLVATVNGDEISGAYTYLKIPESWRREYRRMRSYNSMITAVANTLTLPLVIIFLVFLISQFRSGAFRYRQALVIGLISFLIMVATGLNSIPLTIAGYNTTESYGSFIAGNILRAILDACGAAFLVLLLYSGAEVFYRSVCPEKIALNNLLKPASLRNPKTSVAIIIGYSMAFFVLGYINIFYLIVQKMGGWIPPDVFHTDALTTYAPLVVSSLIRIRSRYSRRRVFPDFRHLFPAPPNKKPFFCYTRTGSIVGISPLQLSPGTFLYSGDRDYPGGDTGRCRIPPFWIPGHLPLSLYLQLFSRALLSCPLR